MAAKGLPDVVQKFAADNADYLRALNENRDAIKGEVSSLEEHYRAVDRNREVVRKFADELGSLQRKLEDIQQIQRRGDPYGPRGDNARTGFFPDRGGSGGYGAYDGSSAVSLGVADAMRRAHEAVTATMQEETAALKAQWAQADAHQAMMSRLNTEYQKRISLEQQVAQTGMNVVRAQTETTNAMKAGAETAANLRTHYGAIVDLQNEIARGSGAASAIFGGRAGPAGYTGSGASDLAGLVALANAAGGGRGGIGRAIFGGGDGGSLLGGIRGGGSFLPPGGTSLGDVLFGGGKSTVAGAHMAVMLTMEVASQIIPAAVAAAAAAAVGTQGAVAAFQRGTGIYNAGEALGGAYKVTPGQLFGLGSGFQVAQNQATGGVYGIIGSLMRMAGQGTGQGNILGPGGMGVQTIAMIDRGMANMVGSNRAAQLSQALGGGTGALQGIGDIFGNLGDTLLNLAPVLPGMGGVLFGGLKAGTGALRSISGLAGGGGLWPLLMGGGLAAEAGFRWGGTALAGGKLPWFLGGGQFKGAAGLAERMGLGTTVDTAAAARAASAAKFGLEIAPGFEAAVGTEGAGTGLAGLLSAGAGGLSTGGIAALIAASAYGISQGQFGTGAAGAMGGYMRNINASFGAGSLKPITAALFQAGMTQGNLPGISYDTVAGQQVPVGEQIGQLRRQGYSPQEALAKVQAEWAANTKNVANQLGQMANAGPAAQKALNDLGIKGASLGQAFDYMTQAMISPKDVGPGGKLDKTAMSQLASFVGTYSLMSAGPGSAAFTAKHVQALQPSVSAITSAAAADYVMATPQMKSLSQINSALDSMTQIMTGGAASASGLFQLGAAAPATVAQAMATAPGGNLSRAQQNQLAQVLQGNPRAARALMASALNQGPFTTAGAAAWQAFTNPQTGIMPASQQNMDQLRTFMTIGGLSGPQAGQLGAFELKQSVLPYASQSPMALAMLQQQAMQAGVPGVKMGQSYAATKRAIDSHAGTIGQANQLMTQGTQAAANIPGVANFLNPSANINALQSAQYAQMAQSALAVAQHPTAANVSALTSGMTMAGVKPGQMKVGVDAVLQNLHVPSNIIAKVNAQIDSVKPPAGGVKVPATADIRPGSGAAHIPPIKVPVNYDVHKGPEPKYKDQHPNVNYVLRAPAPPNYPNISRSVTYVIRTIGSVSGAVGSIGGSTSGGRGYQHGFKVPGWGGGDIVPAMLEPGELVVPKHMVPSLKPFLGGKIPGFQSGGIIDVPTFAGGVGIRSALEDIATQLMSFMAQGFASLGHGAQSIFGGGGSGPHPFPGGSSAAQGVPVHVVNVSHAAAAAIATGGGSPGGGAPMPAAAQKVIDAFEKTFKDMGTPWGKLATQYLQGLLDAVKNPSKETAAQATALTGKVSTAINFGKNLAANTLSGLNLGGMTGLPQPTLTQQQMIDQQTLAGGGTVSVQGQMGDYLQTIKSFQGDLSKLTKGGLSKGILSQLLAAGPQQGDTLAQSILGGPGGIKGANQLYGQIQKASTGLGVQGMEAMYPMMHGKTVKAGVTANAAPVHALQSAINSLHGKTVTIKVNVVESGGGGTGPKLSKVQTNEAIRVVQKGLLQQAKRNSKTNIKLPPPYGT